MKNKNNAFTLAEVLITIAIIGVVASLSISLVFKNYQKMIFETKLKKTYNNLQTAISLSIAQNGSVLTWGESSCNTTSDNCTSNLQAQQINAILDKYIFPYMRFKQIHLDEYKAFPSKVIKPNSNNDSLFATHCGTNTAAITQDGVSILFSFASHHNNRIFVCAIDLNGPKGPNVLGLDVFHHKNALMINQQGFLVPFYCPQGGDDCVKNAYFIGDIMTHNWKIRY